MTELSITTDEGFGEKGIFPRRVVSIDGKSVPTPAGAVPVDRIDGGSQIHSQSRGFNEIHVSVTNDRLDNESRREIGPIVRHVSNATEKTFKDEFTLVFTTYNEREEVESGEGESNKVPVTLDGERAKCIVNSLADWSDLLTVPMFPHLARAVDEKLGPNDPFFFDYQRSVVTFLNHAEEHVPEKPVMGVFPGRLPWDCLEQLFEIYVAFDINAFYVNLDRLKLTADDQQITISKLMNHMAAIDADDGIEGGYQNTFFYLVNAERGQYDAEIEAFPGSDIAAIGFGFDVVGGRRMAPRMSFDEEEEEPPEDLESFYLFDRENLVYRKLKLRNLNHHFPDDSAFEVEDVVRRSRQSPRNDRYQLQALVNSEQIALAAMDYRKVPAGKPASRYFRSKAGITDGISDDMAAVRRGFDSAWEQRDLGEYE